MNNLFYTKPVVHPTRNLDFHDIFYVIDGSFFVRLDSEIYQFNSGDIAVLPASYMHYGTAPCKNRSRLIYIHFSQEPGDRKVTKNEYDTGVLMTNTRIIINKPMVYYYFQELYKIFWSNISYKQTYCSALLMLILAEISETPSMNMVKKDMVIQQIQNFILEHPHQFYTVEELAQQATIGVKSLSDKFKQETGQTVHKFQLNIKLNQISELLRNTSMSIKELAEMYGFYDEYHLSLRFKKRFGISPKYYKNTKT